MTPGISSGFRARLPAVFLLGLELYVLIGFGVFEGLIAAQEWRYRHGSSALRRLARRSTTWSNEAMLGDQNVTIILCESHANTDRIDYGIRISTPMALYTVISNATIHRRRQLSTKP